MMAAINSPARLNRCLLALIGVILLAAGVFGLLFGLGLLRSQLPELDPTAPLIPPDAQVHSWAPYAATAVAVIIGLLSLRWLVAQAPRRPTAGAWELHRDSGRGTTFIDAEVVAAGIAADIESYSGVHKVSASLTGTRAHPALRLEVTTEENTSIAALRHRVASHALPRLCEALEVTSVPADLLLRIDAASPSASRTR